MHTSRRDFLQQAAALSAAPSATPSAAGTAPSGKRHVILLGDSVFDNGAYTGGKPDVQAQLARILPPGWMSSLLARDGATTAGLAAQLERLSPGATHLVLSIGGNDALQRQALLQARAGSLADGLIMLADTLARFETAYREAVAACLARRLPLIICTIYNGNFADPAYRKAVRCAVALFNDAIIRTALDHQLTVIDLRAVCTQGDDYANPIEPSSSGAAKIARAIAAALSLSGSAAARGACMVGGSAHSGSGAASRQR